MASSGSLDQQIILKSLSEANSFGQVTPTYTAVDTVWAEVISQRGQEAFEAARVNAKETIRVRIRFRDDVTNKWRFVWEGQTYNIIHTDRSQRRKGDLWLTGEVVGAL